MVRCKLRAIGQKGLENDSLVGSGKASWKKDGLYKVRETTVGKDWGAVG